MTAFADNLTTVGGGEEPACLVVMYHYVGTRHGRDASGVRGISPSHFEDQLDDLSRWGEPISWSALLEVLSGGRSLPRRGFLLTFDDGLRDHIEIVAPILGERRMTGVFSASGRTLTGGGMCAAHQVHLLLNALPDATLLDAVRTQVQKAGLGIDLATGEQAELERYAYEDPARARLKHLLHHQIPIFERDRILGDLFRAHVGDPQTWTQRWYLSGRDARELDAAGHTIGGHGFSHEPLTRLSGDDADTDVRRCAAVLTDLLGPAQRPFSYPFGAHDDRIADVLRRCGFAAGFTTRSALLTRPIHRWRLPRVDTIHVAAFTERSAVC
ncbi:MAG: polysaccharide deacetylase family protein [Phycisphaerae bacterium]|nr:MAG: hypothetical protein EDS66_05870 [Planctomycetota bacterium]KAB2949559.1 MAG: polysaccharide deacetylase family protein [Phycisphaerae bacterium]MBE7455839.1 polysaccharide deacetylase family protein [Planctomycetia bacterium]MCK6463474.1 polysaccharide deacetylase family protein [Phycisphaerae bacterium]MCL4717097.1 polysaccharide deacetylase family protein [Phycisphaerae bacterium]